MTIPTEGQPGSAPAAEGLTPAEQASVEKGQQGLQEVQIATGAPAHPRPDHVPEQFWNAETGKADYEGLAKSYAELRAKMDAPKEPTPAPASDAPKPDASGKIVKPETPAAAPLQTAISAAQTQFAETGEVTEDTVAALEAAGLPKEIFAVYLDGVKALQEKTLSAIHGFAGGEQQYNDMVAWAAANANDAEIEAFNTALENPASRQMAVEGMYARFTAARPSEGNLLTPAGTPAGAGDTYASRDQLTADMKNPKYQTDAAFRAEVQSKLARSQNVGSMGRVVDQGLFGRTIHTN